MGLKGLIDEYQQQAVGQLENMFEGTTKESPWLSIELKC
jgi:hypothetical protein